MQRRRNSHIEGLATHDDPESCGGAREGVAEALTGAHAGRVLSREIEIDSQVPRLCLEPKATPEHRRVARCGGTWRGRLETPSMRGSTMRENRETLRTARGGWRRGPRWEVRGLEPSMHGGRESDCPVVPTKLPNKGRRRLKHGAMADLNGHEGGNAGDSQAKPKEPSGGRRTARGGGGGKAAGQGECGPAKHAPDTEPGGRAQCAGPHKASSEDGQGETVHGAPAPRLRHRDPARGLLRPQAGRGTWSGRGDVAGVRRATGRKPRRSLRAPATGGVPGEAGPAGATSRSRTDGSGRSGSPRWRTRWSSVPS